MNTNLTIHCSASKEAQRSLLSRLLVPMIVLIGWSNSGCLQHEGDDGELSTITEQITFADHDYLFVMTPKTWAAAKSYCAQYDGNSGYQLVIVNDEREEAFLNEAEMVRGKTGWWIGLSDIAYEGRFVWVDGTLLNNSYANWRPGQPDNNYGTQDCVTDRSGAATPSDYWADNDCTEARDFICERKSVATTNKGSFFYSRNSTSNATVNTFQWGVALSAGMVFTVGTCGVPGASLDTGNTWLRIRNSSGVEVGSNDDSDLGYACGKASNLSIVAGATGTYWINAGCYGDTACSGTVAYNY